MSRVLAWADLRARLAAAALTSAGQPVPVCYPNTSFRAPPGNLPWLRADLSTGSGLPIELGGETWQDEGQAFIDILVPVGTGTDAASAIEDSLKAFFFFDTETTVIYTRIAADPGGSGDDNGQYFITSMRAEWKLTTRVNQGS